MRTTEVRIENGRLFCVGTDSNFRPYAISGPHTPVREDITAEAAALPRSAKGWVDVSAWYQWGDQAADVFCRFSGNDTPVEIAAGCGDNAPYLDATGAPRYPYDDREDHYRASLALDATLSREHGAWLRASYARRENPLPGLRRRVGGAWMFARPDTEWPAEVKAAAEGLRPYGEIEIKGIGTVYWIPA